jgi:hypothetical protein
MIVLIMIRCFCFAAGPYLPQWAVQSHGRKAKWWEAPSAPETTTKGPESGCTIRDEHICTTLVVAWCKSI